MALDYRGNVDFAPQNDEKDNAVCLTKFCKKCSLEKFRFDFSNDISRPDGKYPTCKLCRQDGQAKYREHVRNAVKKIPDTKICSGCKEEKNSSMFKKYKSSVDGLYHYCDTCKNKKAQLKRYMRAYGFSKEQAEEFAKNNVGACEICSGHGKLVVDHCHASGKVRGYICNSCNVVLGFAKDKITTLLSAAEYLKNKGKS